ncbi:VOC family protein [Cellulomonas fimi]|uniref:Glyoxalase/bleomycin resistance protein/dioxygenase n=1 Tax=Cellulomonas fimi (strain ATCC 484 / DSM 20113 / JCM 1341 / CCUG 24087 / LMG 16345 / NBRC 15513 / NCIMB 8980 / NCTC 7547 / NRS-133) TaxID=590998 RepID=F4H355_CELFA|nr:VOC family protein [Cellulomonas fimi]AEE47673.1 Glyoxalase/bleomycin resistance protein/dioxygenase [Cellulomonas fimi ATCC 484]NNH07428.1 VOC family protein [Cellulomonas fimi]VEH36767.1 3-demethylubiquinone-9 3-methyltransferase [Cellulomonas fimi]
MTIATTPHLNFRGDARAALDLYAAAFGGTTTVVTYADAHAVTDAAEADQVMWGQVVSPDGFRVMAYDVPSHTAYEPGVIPVFVSVRGADADELTRYWERLVDGATVVVPLGPAAWAPLYGMLRDRFGVTWVLDVAVPWDAA